MCPFGQHDHHAAQGDCRETINIMKKVMKEMVQQSPRTKAQTIALVVEKTWVLSEILGSKGVTIVKFDDKSHVDINHDLFQCSQPNGILQSPNA